MWKLDPSEGFTSNRSPDRASGQKLSLRARTHCNGNVPVPLLRLHPLPLFSPPLSGRTQHSLCLCKAWLPQNPCPFPVNQLQRGKHTMFCYAWPHTFSSHTEFSQVCSQHVWVHSVGCMNGLSVVHSSWHITLNLKTHPSLQCVRLHESSFQFRSVLYVLQHCAVNTQLWVDFGGGCGQKEPLSLFQESPVVGEAFMRFAMWFMI